MCPLPRGSLLTPTADGSWQHQDEAPGDGSRYPLTVYLPTGKARTGQRLGRQAEGRVGFAWSLPAEQLQFLSWEKQGGSRLCIFQKFYWGGGSRQRKLCVRVREWAACEGVGGVGGMHAYVSITCAGTTHTSPCRSTPGQPWLPALGFSTTDPSLWSL